jgi:ubiquinone/menaquinone biosynthesis C-methylase UbiE
MSQPSTVTDIFVCPICHGQLVGLSCAPCRITFPTKNGVPSFIVREMYPSDDAYAAALRIIDFWGAGWEKRLAEPEHRPLFECDQDALKMWAKQDIEFQKSCDSVMAADDLLDSLEGKRALNIGSGAGTEALLLSLSGADCIAMDVTHQAAQAAEYLIRKICGKGTGIQADARFLPLETSSVDVVYSSGVLHHSPDIARSIAEIHRVLKPGGKAYVMLYATWSIMFVQMRLIRSMGEKAWETENRRNPHTTTYTTRECREMFKCFKDVTIKKTGASVRQVMVIGRMLPTRFDRFLDPYLGPRLNIVAEKPIDDGWQAS